MSEKKAWKYLEYKFINGTIDANEEYVANVTTSGLSYRVCSLCHAIDRMAWNYLITGGNKYIMKDKIHAHAKKMKKNPHDYLWSLTRRGGLARARFCNKMAKKCR